MLLFKWCILKTTSAKSEPKNCSFFKNYRDIVWSGIKFFWRIKGANDKRNFAVRCNQRRKCQQYEFGGKKTITFVMISYSIWGQAVHIWLRTAVGWICSDVMVTMANPVVDNIHSIQKWGTGMWRSSKGDSCSSHNTKCYTKIEGKILHTLVHAIL